MRAAEKARSPAMVQVFPATLEQLGRPFLRFCLDICREASMPISVHLDYFGTEEDINLALTWAEQGIVLDSIMIDCS